MTTTMHHLKQRQLKRQLASKSYSVDPEQVAAAIIVKLAQSGAADPDGPSRGNGGLFRLRQAA